MEPQTLTTRDDPWRDLRILDALPNAVWTHDALGRTRFVNASYREYTGLSEADGDWLAIVHPDDRERCGASWERARAVGTALALECRLRRADGTYRWHDVRGRPTTATPPLWCVSATDVEEDRHIREQLEYTNAASRLLAASLDAPATINELLDLVTPRFADCCFVDTFDEEGVFVERYIRGDERIVALLRRDLEQRLRAPHRRTGAWTVLETGRPRLRSVDPRQLRANSINDEHYALLCELAATSVLSLPLRVGGQTIGVVSLVAREREQPYSERDVAFFQDLAARTAVAIGNAQAYVREHRIATRLQRAMLPDSVPRVEGLRLDAAYLPADEELLIGGDWYDAFVLPNDRLAVSIGDVAGHGLEAAITMSQIRHALRVAALEQDDPGDILTAVNRALGLGDDMKIATATVAIVDRRTLSMRYANAGHPPPALVGRGGERYQLAYGELPLGIDPEGLYETHAVQLEPGMLAVFYTDGLVETEHDLQRGILRLHEAITAERAEPLPRLARRLIGRVLTAANADDIAILTMQVEGVAQEIKRSDGGAIRWAFQADDASAAHDARSALLAYLRSRGASDSDYQAAEIIFGELVGNVVKHAPGPILIELMWDGEAPTLRVTDRGPGFELRAALPHDVMSESGRGLFLASAFASELAVTRLTEGGARVSATLPVRRQPVAV